MIVTRLLAGCAGLWVALAGPGLIAQTRYPPERNNSPLTATLADRIRSLAAAGIALGNDPGRLMKVGDSITANGGFLAQFKCPDHDPESHYPWDWTRDISAFPHLADAADHFRLETVPGDSNIPDAHVGGVPFPVTCFDRVSLAVQVGQSAEWAVTGDPSPLRQEIDALHPLYAVVMFGANDTGGYGSDADVLRWAVGNQAAIVDACLAQGVVPLLTATCPKYTSDSDAERTRTLGHLARALAQGRQVPFIDCHRALMPLPNHGLGSDNLHPDALDYNRACHLTPEGLRHGFNMRNRVTLEALNQVYQAVVNGVESLDPEPAPLAGSGTSLDPFIIDTISFIDCRVATAGNPSFFYRLDLLLPMSFQGIVTCQGTTQMNIRLLDAGFAEIETAECLVTHMLAAGTWFVEVGTRDGHPGEYQLAVMDRADPGYPRDMNLDGTFDALDRRTLADYLAGNITGLPCGELCGDFNGNGIDACDVVELGKIFVQGSR